jgi:hypothetical protein
MTLETDSDKNADTVAQRIEFGRDVDQRVASFLRPPAHVLAVARIWAGSILNGRQHEHAAQLASGERFMSGSNDRAPQR